MRICRYDDNKIGVVRGDQVHDVSEIVNEIGPVNYPLPRGDLLIANLDRLRPIMEKLADKAPGKPISGVKLLSPVANPTKIIGTPVNYKLHAEEGQADVGISQGRPPSSIEEQGLFLKANSALIGPGEGVAVRFPDRRTDHEAELGVIIGREGSDIPYEDALSYVAGYAVALDMVVRGPEDRSFRKSVDSYAVLGPWLTTADEVADPGNIDFSLTVAGEVRQKSNTGLMILDIARQISWGSTFYTLHPGDIIMTGTCEGVSPIKPGDVMKITFEGVGSMEVAIRAHG
jgi:2-keto-4-pentenoate hydratase/2-oxohepta-3-ene-1,7-dioic acid hydratase in catechol pathway